MKKSNFRIWLRNSMIASIVVVLLFSIWAIWYQHVNETYIDRLLNRNPVFRNRIVVGRLPMALFEIRQGLGGYTSNYGDAFFKLQLLSPEGEPYRSVPINYVMYRYFSDKEIDSINFLRSTP